MNDSLVKTFATDSITLALTVTIYYGPINSVAYEYSAPGLVGQSNIRTVTVPIYVTIKRIAGISDVADRLW